MQKAILGRPPNIPERVFLKMSEMSQENNCPPHHSYSNHNFWISRHGVCPYCNLGSKRVYGLSLQLRNILDIINHNDGRVF